LKSSIHYFGKEIQEEKKNISLYLTMFLAQGKKKKIQPHQYSEHDPSISSRNSQCNSGS
jgi:hypothetical protein